MTLSRIIFRAAPILALALTSGHLMAGVVSLDFAGTTSTSFTDTYGYFGTADAVYGIGTSIGMTFSFVPGDCSTHSEGASSDEYSNCSAGSFTTSLTLDGVTISGDNFGGPSDVSDSSYDTTESEFNYLQTTSASTPPQYSFNDYLYSSDAYVLGALGDGPPADVILGTFEVCSQYNTNCDAAIASTNLEDVAPEPATFGLIGIALCSLGFIRRRLARN